MLKDKTDFLQRCDDSFNYVIHTILSYAECDAVNGVRWDFGICFLAADPEEHKGVWRYGCGGIQGFTQPSVRATLEHFNCYLQSR